MENGELALEPVTVSDDEFEDLKTSGEGDAKSTIPAKEKVCEWPYPFRCKSTMFSTAIFGKLKEQEKLTRHDRSKVLESLYEEATKYTLYPNSSQYDQMVSALLSTFPYLGRGMAGQDASGFYKTKLRETFNNNRRRHESDKEEVMLNKRKKPTEDGKAAKEKEMNVWCVKNFKPELGAGEDATSINILTKQMQASHAKKKKQQDPILTRTSMEKTFRRREG
ncbi:uncharacterized protein [Amphiura filiformis]|uniref:uncharacterized protein n=1 Tax=Amphiura filiformis TaxID=82378 RepID=UPI003B20FC37